MSKNKKHQGRRKPGRPAKVMSPGTLPVIFAVPKSAETKIALIAHTALNALLQGVGQESHAYDLTARLNLGTVLATNYHDSQAAKELELQMQESLSAMRIVFERHQDSGRWGVHGDEFRAIGRGLNLTDSLVAAVSRRELSAAMQYVIDNAAIKPGQESPKAKKHLNSTTGPHHEFPASEAANERSFLQHRCAD